MTRGTTFSLYLYDTKFLLLTLLGSMLLGTAAVFGLQSILFIPAWVQYLVLTALIVVAFLASGCLAARPATVAIEDQAISITQKDRASREVSWGEITAYAYYQELLLYSLKISLHGHEMLSIINFKWSAQEDFRTFLKQFETRVKAKGEGEDQDTVARAETFYGSKKKIAITIGVFIVYVGVVVMLLIGDAFANWNPIFTYYFWVLPIAFFVKMLKAT
jgi:hypothetical protein